MKLKRFLRRFFKIIVFFSNLFSEQTRRELRNIFNTISKSILAVCAFVIPVILTFLFGIVVFDVGYHQFYSEQPVLFNILRIILIGLSIFVTARFLFELTIHVPLHTRFANLLLVLVIFYLISVVQDVLLLDPVRGVGFALKKILLYSGITLLFVIETSHIIRFIYRRGTNPAFLFVGSFALLILIGGFLLLLPNATTTTIQPVDALFTSVSAVCVTGLTVVDTSTSFTTFGKVIILFLIQMGGFGIMTFAGMISYLVTGTVSFQNQLALRDMISADRLSNVISFVSRIVFVTVCFEIVGALFIYSSLSEGIFDNEWEKIFFAVFHSVSAFCNAGFSTFSNGLYEEPLRFNYSLHWTIATLIVLGGTGFPVVFNIFTFLRIKISNFVKRLYNEQELEVFTNILPASSKLALGTTGILLVAGFVSYFIFEFNATLRPHDTMWGKITTSIFGSVTPRTAGFNTVDLTMMQLPTVMIYLLLMWIGASPGSTGGGIKTTVAAIAFLNMKSIVFGHKKTEVHRSEVSQTSINRAFAIIILSLLILGVTVLLLSINDSEKGLLKLAFEAFSAFSTVGLTLGVTPQLSWFGKLVIMAVMFIGRVGALTLLFAVVTKSETRHYRYPTEDIMF